MNIESSEQNKLCKYLDYQYPKVLYCTDLSGIRLTIGQAVKVKKNRKGRAWPDMFFPEPRGKYHGLYIEMKAPDVRILKQNCQMIADKHIKEQFDMLCLLESRGYMARFGIGFEGAKKIVDEYLNIK